MARKPALNADALAALGAEKLALLVLDEAARSAPFRKVVNAALAGAKGPEAVAKQIDRRLIALEKARSLVDWRKERAFRLDLEATLRTILDELGRASPTLAIDRLLRFVATHGSVFERIDDSSGRIQDVYGSAVAGLASLAAAMREEDRRQLPARLQPVLHDDAYGYGLAMALSVAPLLPHDVLAAWDAQLARDTVEAGRAPAAADAWEQAAARLAVTDLRQAIAEARGDLDGLIALETTKPPRSQDAIGVAERLLAAGRAAEALDWVRRKSARPAAYPDDAGLHYDGMTAPSTSERRLLEARILDAAGRQAEAQAVRWSQFEAELDAPALRAFVERLGDFEEFEVMDRAFAHVMGSKRRHRALCFLLDWPRLDKAADLVVAQAAGWDGRNYALLGTAAEALEDKHPLAATVLYRTLLSDILDRAKSQAYGHGARYLDRLDALEKRIAAPDMTSAGLAPHHAYRTSLQSAHRRKSAFWSQVDGRAHQF